MTVAAAIDLAGIADILSRAGLASGVASPMPWPGPGVTVTCPHGRGGIYLVTPVTRTGHLRVRWTPDGGRMQSIGDVASAGRAAAMILDHQDNLLP